MEDFDVKEFVGKFWPVIIVSIILVVILYFLSGVGWSAVRHVFNDVFDLTEHTSVTEYRNGTYGVKFQYPVDWIYLSSEQLNSLDDAEVGWELSKTDSGWIEESVIFKVGKDDFTYLDFTIERLFDLTENDKEVKLSNVEAVKDDVVRRVNINGLEFVEAVMLGKETKFITYMIKVDGICHTFVYITYPNSKYEKKNLVLIHQMLSTLEFKNISERF